MMTPDVTSLESSQVIVREPRCVLCKNMFRVKDEVYGRKKADFMKYRNLCHRKCLEKAAANELITTNQFLEFVEKKYLEKIDGQPKTI